MLKKIAITVLSLTLTASAALAEQPQFEIRQGQSLQCAVPAGWSFSSTNNGIDSSAPDGVTWVSRVFLRGGGQMTPDGFTRMMANAWPNYGITNVQLVSQKNLAANTKLYEMNYSFRGQPAHCVIQTTVNGNGFGYLADMTFLQSSQQGFQQMLPTMITMAKSVQVTNGNAFADAGKFNAEAQKRQQIVANSQRDIGNTITSNYENQQRSQDAISLQRSDTMRDQTRFDGTDGQQYVGSLDTTRAFEHQDGTVTGTNDVTMPVPSDATELQQHNYYGQ